MHLVLYILFYASPSMHLSLSISFYASYTMHLILFISRFAVHLMHHILCILFTHPFLYISFYASHYMNPIICILFQAKLTLKWVTFHRQTHRQTNWLTLSDTELITQQKVKYCLFGWLTVKLDDLQGNIKSLYNLFPCHILYNWWCLFPYQLILSSNETHLLYLNKWCRFVIILSVIGPKQSSTGTSIMRPIFLYSLAS